MLDTIVARTRADLPMLYAREKAILTAAESAGPVADFAGSLSEPGLGVIAEVKRRSPSRGSIDAGLDPVAMATRYAQGGAAAISVLTESHHFDGSPEDLAAVRSAVTIPLLRKDFIVDPLQVWQARAIGADAVLLIVAALTDEGLVELLDVATAAGLSALVEVHDRTEARRAVAAGSRIVGVNNRDLATFDVDLATSERLAGELDGVAVRVAESGIWTADQAHRMYAAGYDAVLVGEALVRADDPASLVEAFRTCG